MLKLSFKVQLAFIIITIIIIVVAVKFALKDNGEQAQIALTKAMQTSDYGFQMLFENAMAPNLLNNISGTTPDGGIYSVSVTNDTISVDTMEVRIESRGEFDKKAHSQSKRILLISEDSINWRMAD